MEKTKVVREKINESQKIPNLQKLFNRAVNRANILNNILDATEKENTSPMSLVDETYELTDPNPSIYELFKNFDIKFFGKKLYKNVEVRWSNRMTSCAGTCSFHKRTRHCVISLSVPLLKLRPRKDLVETLLHEMIHAYLFLSNEDRDRDGHGYNFCKHMFRINREAGTNITIYHNFHDEVKLYKQHWWKCNGPCQHKPPYFGTVRRATNRAPGQSDCWWYKHQMTCNGQFIKIKEPDNFKSRSKLTKDKKSSQKSISNWLVTNSPRDGDRWPINKPIGKKEKDKTSIKPKFSCSGVLGGSKDGKSNLLTKFPLTNEKKRNTYRPEASGSGLSSEPVPTPPVLNLSQQNQQRQPRPVNRCPICNVFMTNIYRHIDVCLIHATSLVDELNNNVNNNNIIEEFVFEPQRLPVFSQPPTNVDCPNKYLRLDNSSETVACPVCGRMIISTSINEHLDECLLKNPVEPNAAIPSTSYATSYDDDVINISSSSNSDLNDSATMESTKSQPQPQPQLQPQPQPQPRASTERSDTMDVEKECLVCKARISPEVSLNEHLEECMRNFFSDDNMIIKDDENKNDKNDNDDDDVVYDVFDAENNFEADKYPCPVCMEMISENLMNQHLDMCLKN